MSWHHEQDYLQRSPVSPDVILSGKAKGTPLSLAIAPNDLWCADFKGEFRLGNGRYCYPLTVTDQASRYLLLAEALESTKQGPVIEAFVRLFKQCGLPTAIGSDNGLPFDHRPFPMSVRG